MVLVLWLPIQGVLAVFAWCLAVRTVSRVHDRAWWGGSMLAVLLGQSARAEGRPDRDLLLSSIEHTSFGASARQHGADLAMIELECRADLAGLGGSDRVLRGLATIATTLGLLGAVATLRTLLGDGSAGSMPMSAGAAQAMDCAVLGLATALPCWTGVSLCRARLRSARRETAQAISALGATGFRARAVDEGDPAAVGC